MISYILIPNSKFQEISYDKDLGLHLKQMQRVILVVESYPTDIKDLERFT